MPRMNVPNTLDGHDVVALNVPVQPCIASQHYCHRNKSVKDHLGLAHRKLSFTFSVCVFLNADELRYFWPLVCQCVCVCVWSTCQSSNVCVLRAFASDEPHFTRCVLAWCLKRSVEFYRLSATRQYVRLALCNTWYRQNMDCTKTKINSMAWARERNIPPLIGEASANLCIDGATWSARRIPTTLFSSRLSRPEPILFLSSRSSIVLTRLNGPRSRLTTSQKFW
jgi:hypothetical protein